MKRKIEKLYKRIYYRVKYKISYVEAYNPDIAISKKTLLSLHAFKNLKKNGHPIDLESIEEWNEIIDKILFSFAYLLKDEKLNNIEKKIVKEYEEYRIKEEIGHDKNGKTIVLHKNYNENIEKYNEGMNLFFKYYNDLWD
jgi:hypothetical protein